MPIYVALLYSIVLGPGRRVVMSELRDLAEGLGFERPRTVAATGNLVFEAPETAIPDLEAALEAAVAARLGRPIDVIVRGAEEWRTLAAANPFPAEAAADGSRVCVRVGRAPLEPAVLGRLREACRDDERIEWAGGDLWLNFSRDPGGSRLLAAVTPKKLGGAGTLRNWNTVRNVAALLSGVG